MRSIRIACAALGGALCLVAPASLADDTALFTAAVPPNVVLVVDNSGSMNNVVWHPEFDPATDDPSCNHYDDDTTYSFSSTLTLTRCDNERTLYPDPGIGGWTRIYGKYLNWIFSDESAAFQSDIASSTNGTRSACLVGEGMPANYSKYRRSRISAAKEVLREVVCNVNATGEVRFGLAQFYDDSDPEGGWVVVPVADYSLTHGALIEGFIQDLTAESWTPLSETLFNVYRYFQSRTSPGFGKDGVETFPAYDIRTNGDTTTTSSLVPGTPVQYTCQKNFVIMITDGEPTKDDFDGFDHDDFTDLIGNYNTDDTLPEAGDETPSSCTFCNETSWYLDDIAKFMHEKDFQRDFDGDQTIDVYTVGFTTGTAANQLLEKTALASEGLFFKSNNAEELAPAIVAAVTDVIEKSQTFTAATVPALRATDGNNFFTSYFVPAAKDAYWEGHLKLFEFNAAGEIRDAPTAAQAAAGNPGDCALDDPVSGRCKAGRLKIELDGYWDAANEVPSAAETTAGRRMLVSRYQLAPPPTIPAAPDTFTTGTVSAADLGVTAADLPVFDSLFDPTNPVADEEDLADAIVHYVRGCEFDPDTCVDRGDSKKLWDIFHSTPAVIGPPNRGLTETSYRTYVTKYKNRKRVIYAGSNGGFLHAFNAGEYGTTAVPDSYDRGTGVEEFAFMPYEARRRIADLPVDLPPRDEYYVDAPLTAADVWLYPDPRIAPDDVTGPSWNRWRSVLLAGLRQGGRSIFALDVTNPPDHNSPSGEQPAPTTGPIYPGYLWEFPCESGDAQCTGTGLPGSRAYADYMGDTWSQPVVTRVRVTVDCTTNCTEYDRWVAIFGAGYDPAGDPNDPVGYDASDDTGTSRAGRAIFMVDIKSGKVLAMKAYDDNALLGEKDMKFAVASAPSVFDLDRNGYADVVYIPDLGGNVWKWVIDKAVPDPINGTGNITQPDWEFFRFFSAASCGTAEGCTVNPHYRSFFFPPKGALVGSSLYLTFGSGERVDLDYVGTDPDERNRFYVMKDLDPLERESTAPSSGARYTDAAGSTDLVDVANLPGGCTPPPPPAVGFYLNADQGEKFITASEIFFGVVLAGSFKPSASTDPCTSAGDAYAYAFDLFCGDGVFTSGGGGGTTVRINIGSGIPNQPRVSVGPAGGGGGGGSCQDMVVMIASDGAALTDCTGGRPDSGIGLKTSRELE